MFCGEASIIDSIIFDVHAYPAHSMNNLEQLLH